MKTLTIAAALLAAVVAVPALSMGTPPKVDDGKDVVPAAEATALSARHSCVRSTFDKLPSANRRPLMAKVDNVSTEHSAAITAQKVGNRAAFDQHRANVERLIKELGFKC